MHTALRCVYIIRETQDHLIISIVILQSDLGYGIVPGTCNIDHFIVQGRFVAVDVGDKLLDATGIAHFVSCFPPASFIDDPDLKACVQKRLLTHAR